MELLSVVLVTALVATAVTLLWEAWIRPAAASRSVAELVAVDLGRQANAIMTDRQRRIRDPRAIPATGPVTTQLYAAALHRFGDLPRGTVPDVVAVYRDFERLDVSAARAGALHERLAGTTAGDARRGVIEHQLAEELAAWDRTAAAALGVLHAVQPRLIAAAAPWWSARYWMAPRPEPMATPGPLPGRAPTGTAA